MTFDRLSVPSDLSFAAFEEAQDKLYGNVSSPGDNWVLVVPEKDAFTAGQIAERHKGIAVVILPDEMLSSEDSWCLSRMPTWAIWSPGAG